VDCNYTLYGRSGDSWGFSNAWYLHCQLSTNHLILSHQTSSVNGEDAVQTGVFVSDAPVKLLRWLTIKNCVPFYLLCGTSGNFTPNTAFEMMQDKRCRHGIPSGSSIRLNGAWASDWPFIIIYLLLAALGWRNTCGSQPADLRWFNDLRNISAGGRLQKIQSPRASTAPFFNTQSLNATVLRAHSDRKD
jgi:hypothetical protein